MGRDGGRGDAMTTCAIDCAAPPPGCHYEGDATCEPPMCPTLVCDDDAGTCAPCPAPPPDCYYTDPCVCGGLLCDEISCGPGAPTRFPEFDRSCASEEECVLVRHITDCCGTTRVMGIAASESARFESAEAVCDAMYPACGCASGLTTADDGTNNMDGAEPTLRCAAGLCTSTFAP